MQKNKTLLMDAPLFMLPNFMQLNLGVSNESSQKKLLKKVLKVFTLAAPLINNEAFNRFLNSMTFFNLIEK